MMSEWVLCVCVCCVCECVCQCTIMLLFSSYKEAQPTRVLMYDLVQDIVTSGARLDPLHHHPHSHCMRLICHYIIS